MKYVDMNKRLKFVAFVFRVFGKGAILNNFVSVFFSRSGAGKEVRKFFGIFRSRAENNKETKDETPSWLSSYVCHHEG